MTSGQVLHELRRIGVEVRADGQRLRYRPLHALDARPDLLAALREHRAEILDALRSGDCGAQISASPPPVGHPFVVQLPDEGRASDRAVLVRPGEPIPNGAIAWRERDRTEWHRLGNKRRPPSSSPSDSCRTCRGTRYWRHAVYGHALCHRCHPPATPEASEAEWGAAPALAASDDWGPGVAPLVRWFVGEGQHGLPTAPFHLTPWIEVIDPKSFRDSLLFDIACGPCGPRNRFGAVEEDLRQLHDKFRSHRGGTGK